MNVSKWAAGILWPPLEGEATGVDRWPLRKFPLLVDSERNIVETSIIIIEYLQLAHPGPVPLLARRFGLPRTSDSCVGDSPLPPPSTFAAVRRAARD